MNESEENNTLNSTGFPKADTFELVVVGISLTTIAVFGIVANVISLCVFSRPEMKSSVNCCLQGLAMFDIAVLICAIFLFGLRSLGRGEASFLREYTWKISPFIITFLYPVALGAQTGSIWTTVAVTVERYVAVCHPLKARSFCTYRRARYYNLTVLFFAIAYNVPRCFEVQRLDFFDPSTNETYYNVVMSDFRKNKVYFKVYYIGMYLLFMYVIPFAVLSVLNGLIWKTVHSANRDRRLLSRRLRKEFGLAVMLLGVVAIFIFCNMLAPITNILEFFEKDVPYIVYTSNLLVVINSSANLVVYCLFGHRFKRFLLHIFCRKDVTELAYYSRDSVRWTSIRLTTPKSSVSSGQTNQIAISSISMETNKIKSRDSLNH